MKEPTKAELAAGNKRLQADNAALRDLLAAVHEAADAAPFPASYVDREKAFSRSRDLLVSISVITNPAGSWAWGWCPGDAAVALRGFAAEPLRYKPYAEPEPAPDDDESGEDATEAIAESSQAERDLPKVYVSPCNDEDGHEPCSGIVGLCDCDCHVFAASVMSS